jgi:hypothetical protein
VLDIVRARQSSSGCALVFDERFAIDPLDRLDPSKDRASMSDATF